MFLYCMQDNQAIRLMSYCCVISKLFLYYRGMQELQHSIVCVQMQSIVCLYLLTLLSVWCLLSMVLYSIRHSRSLVGQYILYTTRTHCTCQLSDPKGHILQHGLTTIQPQGSGDDRFNHLCSLHNRSVVAQNQFYY